MFFYIGNISGLDIHYPPIRHSLISIDNQITYDLAYLPFIYFYWQKVIS